MTLSQIVLAKQPCYIKTQIYIYYIEKITIKGHFSI